ncbi:hypothetical protein TNIN_449761 [Trichonephila inaurata madagascariensis]|uniref:Uncharacterized protein n=1 Tax=Trichonephila inaurata madagascariensis TaxID=2747483 RepID=A0A8X6M8H7_9ARAC|nr:hypothetical protein TNIN_449761 [Trichonephila inaurata madagascariensis]
MECCRREMTLVGEMNLQSTELRSKEKPRRREMNLTTYNQPIIGADFLLQYGLLVDIRHGRLLDSLTKSQTQGAAKE